MKTTHIVLFFFFFFALKRTLNEKHCSCEGVSSHTHAASYFALETAARSRRVHSGLFKTALLLI